MKESARVQTVIELLAESAAQPKPTDSLISAYFRAHRFIGSKDRAAIAGRVYVVLRHHARLHWWLDYQKYQANEKVKARAVTLVYLRLVEKLEAKNIIKLFDGSSYGPKPLNDAEKKLLGHLEGRTLLHPEMPEAVQLECPDWAYEKLKAALGADFEKEMRAMLEEAPLDLRVNSLKASRDDVLIELEKNGIEAQSGPLSDLGIRVKGRPAIASLDIFKKGWIEIQDEGSQLVASLVEARPSLSVVDFCAGAGGKTLALAAFMQNKGRIIACDTLHGRLKRARERFRRAGMHNIEIRELSSENDDWVKRNTGKHDRVLVDAPCSGTGTWRRNPDARWKRLGPALEELTALQARILKSAARLVKPGGRLIYATCSLLPEENEQQVEAFLKEYPDFKLMLQREGDFLKLTPARHGTDGFFAAVVEKKA